MNIKIDQILSHYSAVILGGKSRVSRMRTVQGTMTEQTGSCEFPVWQTMVEMTGHV